MGMIIQTISMKSVTAEGLGTLSVFEGGHDVPFDIKRIYYIYGAPQGTQRGGHAHKALRQVLWCPYGSILIRLDDGHETSEVLLNDPACGARCCGRRTIPCAASRRIPTTTPTIIYVTTMNSKSG